MRKRRNRSKKNKLNKAFTNKYVYNRRRKMPIRLAIYEHWKEWLKKYKAIEVKDERKLETLCWACCTEYADVVRCHIIPRSKCKNDNADNLFLMCDLCHKTSENRFDTVEQFLYWAKERNAIDLVYENVLMMYNIAIAKKLGTDKELEENKDLFLASTYTRLKKDLNFFLKQLSMFNEKTD